MVRKITDVFYKSVRLIWQELTEVSKRLTDPVERRRAKLLASVMLVLSFLNLSIFIIAQINLYRQGIEILREPSAYSWLFTSVFTFFIYGISRSKYYHIGAWLFASLIFLSTSFVVILLGETDSVVGYLITVLIVSIWFDVRATSIVTGLAIILTIFVSINAPPISPASAAVTIFGCALLLVFVNHRNQIEKDRQTELSKVNETLRRSEAKLKNSQAVAQMGDWTWNITTDTVKWSDETYRIFGLKREEISDDLSATLIQIIHPDDRAKVRQSSKMIQTGARPEPFAYRVIRPDGSVRRVLTQQGESVFDGNGQVTQLTGIVQDITERKHMEESFRESKQLLDNFVNNTPTYIYIKDIEGRHLFINRKYENEYDLDNEEVQGKTDYDLFPKYIAEGFHATDLKVIQTESIVSLEEISIINGEERINLSTKFPLYDSDGKVYAVGGISQDVTERKQAEQTLSQTASLLTNVINTSSDLIFVKDTKLRTILANTTFASALGKIPEELYGKTDVENGWDPELVHGNSEKGIRGFENDDREALGGELVYNPSDSGNINGEIRYFDTTKMPLRDEAGEIFGVLGIAHDVTERRQIEESLKQQQELLQQMIDLNPNVVIVKDYEGKFVQANHAAEKQFGLRAEEMIGKTDLDIHPVASEAASFMRNDQEVLETLESKFISQEPVTYANGDLHWHQTAKIPLINSDGQQHIMTVSADITGLKQTENRLFQQNSQLEAILSISQDFIFILDNTQKIIDYMADEESGLYVVEDVYLGKTFQDIYPSNIGNQFNSAIENVIQSGGKETIQYLFKPSSLKGERWYEATISSKKRQLIVVVHDITERKLADEQKIELVIQHNRIKLLEEIISDLSHDIKTPLSSIMNNLYMLRKKEAVSKHHKRHLDKIERQALRLNKLVEDILTMARLDKGAVLLFAPLNLNSLIENIGDLYYERAAEKNINLTFDLSKDLPSIQGNESELSRVFANLIENAITYSATGEMVLIKTSAQDKEIIVEIQDNGIGIDKADLLHIFDRFYRADKARRTNQGGTGLGLAIAKKILELHGGKIEIESILEEGSTFKIQLPVEQDN